MRLKVAFNPGRLHDEVANQARSIFVDEMLTAAEELQRLSPVGATGDLQRGWDVTQPRRSPVSFEIAGSVANAAPNALNRIVGRGPGTPPPIAPLKAWVAAKGLPAGVAYAVAKKIAKEGTDRWRSQSNFAGLTRLGKVTADSPIYAAQQRIAERIKRLKIK